MRQRSQLKWMLTASTDLATSFTLISAVRAAEENGTSRGTASTEDHGRAICVNDDAPVKERPAAAPPVQGSTFAYWNSRENRWKAVPSAKTGSGQAARSAAAEVSEFYGRHPLPSTNARIRQANSHGHQATPEQVDQWIVMAAARHDVDPTLVRAAIKLDSNLNSNAVSRPAAMGLMQRMPKTARESNVKNPLDLEQNAGLRHLKCLLEKYNGDVNLTLAAHRAGEGAVRRSAGLPPIAETRDYVRRITHLYHDHGEYGRLDPSQSGASRHPVHVQRDERGVLYISNTDSGWKHLS